MCGIAGIAHLRTEPNPDTLAPIAAMTSSLAHRGPDESGVARFERCVLGHQRLKVIDLVGGQQPMTTDDGRVAVVFNGEIFNYRQLREELRRDGHPFRHESDTEVVLRGYLAWGDAVFSRLDGEFAIGIYDDRERTLLLARDRLGVKPLYYASAGDLLLFGSEVKALLAHPSLATALEPTALTSYLSYRYPLGAASWFRGVKMLEPGHLLTVTPRSSGLRQWWTLPSPSARPRSRHELDDLAEELHERLLRAVATRLVADVPIGAYLSGGLDSSLIVALMAERCGAPVRTFTARFNEAGFDEAPFARTVAERYGTEHHEVLVESSTYEALYPELIRQKDAPLSVPNEIALYALSREIKSHATVMLSGEGADELFAGYGRIFRSPYDLERVLSLANGTSGLTPDEGECFLRAWRGRRSDPGEEVELSHFLGEYCYTSVDDQRALFTDEFLATIDHDVGLVSLWRRDIEKLGMMPYADKLRSLFETRHLPGLLLRLDAMTMAYAVEARVPFVDHHLVGWVYENVPYEMLLPWRSEEARSAARPLPSWDISESLDEPKALLRRCARKLQVPPDIVERRKLGFPVPLERWLDGWLGRMAGDVLLDTRARQRGILRSGAVEQLLHRPPSARTAQTVWMLVGFELWARSYLDAEEDGRCEQ